MPDLRRLGYFIAVAEERNEPGSVALEVTSLFADGELVSVEWTSRARTPGGQLYENHCAGVFRVRDGKILACASTWPPSTPTASRSRRHDAATAYASATTRADEGRRRLDRLPPHPKDCAQLRSGATR